MPILRIPEDHYEDEIPLPLPQSKASISPGVATTEKALGDKSFEAVEKKLKESISKDEKELRKRKISLDLVDLLLPRLIAEQRKNLEINISYLNKRKDKGDIEHYTKMLDKILSGEVYTSVSSVFSTLIYEEMTEEEINAAIVQETATIKLTGMADRVEYAFNKAIGNDQEVS